MKINSNEYWNARFDKDWIEYGGGEQSRYFSRLLVESLPEWLKKDIRDNNYKVCDWGCAQGDGTDIFSAAFMKKVIGIDFSSVAIEQAKEKYPSSDFINLNLLDDTETPEVKYDVIISSNTIEHFHEPFKVLNTLKSFANNLMIISIPYEEIERIDEHHFTFLSDNIPLNLDSCWSLLFHRVVDCREHSPSFWPGKQIVLVYCNQSWLDSQKLTIADTQTSTSFDVLYYSEKLLKISDERNDLKNKLEASNEELNKLKKLSNESVFKKIKRKFFRE